MLARYATYLACRIRQYPHRDTALRRYFAEHDGDYSIIKMRDLAPDI